jgi:hypothetical protein
MNTIQATRVAFAAALLAGALSLSHAAADRPDRSDRSDGRRRKDSNGSKESPAPAAAPGSPSNGFEAFKLIVDRNIFDPNRLPRRSGGEERAPRIDEISLVGTMQSDAGPLAFFESPDSALRKNAHQGDTVGEFKVERINQDGVELTREQKPLSLKVAQQLRRAEGGEWNIITLVAAPPPRADGKSEIGPVPAAGVLTPEPEIPADASETLKKLLEKRKKQLSK